MRSRYCMRSFSRLPETFCGSTTMPASTMRVSATTLASSPIWTSGLASWPAIETVARGRWYLNEREMIFTSLAIRAEVMVSPSKAM